MRLICSIFLLLLITQQVSAQVSLKQVSPNADEFIVVFKEAAITEINSVKGAESRRKSMANLRQGLAVHIENLKKDLSDTGLQIVRELWLRQSVAIRIPPIYRAKISALPYVLEVNPDNKYQVQPQVALSLSGENVTTGIYRIDIDQLWSEGFRGQGVVVAFLDTGVDYLHNDLRDRWRGGNNSWFDPYGEFTSPVDPLDSNGNAHGTGVASVAVGGNLNETGNYLGVAPHATWIGARVINGQSTSESAIISALQWVLDPDGNPATDDFPDIVQNSWGLSGSEGACINPFATELAAIDAAGIDIVFSIGNTGSNASTYLTPTFDGHVISVGAVDATDKVLTSSARGPDKCNSEVLPSLVAPGASVIVADSTFGGLSSNLDNVAPLTGTSFSAPMVAGALALLRSKYQSQNHLDFRQALYGSTVQLGATSPNDDYGRGLVQASAAGLKLETESLKANPTVSRKSTEVNFSSAQYVFTENTSGAVSITVIRSGDISSAASIRVISDNGTATGGQDFEVVDATINFLENESIKKVELTLLDDGDAEGDEAFSLRFVIPFNSLTPGLRNTLPISIADDDKAAATAAAADEIGGASINRVDLLLLITFLSSGLFARRAPKDGYN